MAARFDVFLSHNSRNKSAARELAEALKRRGLRPWLDEEALTPGRRWKREIQEALGQVNAIAVLIGAEGYGPWHGMEADVYLERAVREEKAFIPVLLPGGASTGELPAFFGEFTAVDLRDGITETGIDRLVRGIRAAQEKRIPSRAGRLWTVPLPRNPCFVGREDVLADLHARLTSSGRAALSQAITGLGGIGKTQTAAEYCHLHRDDYSHVLWIDAESTSSLADGYGDLARRLGLVGETEADPERIRSTVLRWLEEEEGWLLVLDNADTPELLRTFVPTGARGRVLITSRSSSLPGLGVGKPLPLEVMTPEESLSFLIERVGDGNRDAAAELAAELGHLPLALEQAAAYMAEHSVSFATYLAGWRKRHLELLERQGPLEGGYRATVATTWAVSFDRVEAASPAAADALRVAAFLAPDGIPEELFGEAAEHLGPALAAKFGEQRDELGVAELLAPLSRFSLIRRDPETRTFSVHRLVQEAVKSSLDEAGRSRWLGCAVEGLNALFPSGVAEPASWPRCRRLYLHATAIAGLLDGSGVERASAGRLLSQAGFFLQTQGRYQEARELIEKAVEVNRRVLGEEHPDTLMSRNNLAGTLWDLGDLSGACELCERVLEVQRRVLGEEHPDTLLSMNNLAETLVGLSDLAGARELHEQVLDALRRVQGEEHPDTLKSMNNLANTLGFLGDLAGARELHEQSLKACCRVLGEKHPDTLTAMSNLAETLRHLGDLVGARELHEQVLEVRRRLLGEEHPDTLKSMNNLAVTLYNQGERQAARELMARAVEGRRRVLGEEHPDTQPSLRLLRQIEEGLHSQEAEAPAKRGRRSKRPRS